MHRFIVNWFADEQGQDLIEYVLLGSFLALAAVAGTALLTAAMASTYTSWDTSVQSDALVEVPEPQGAP